MIDANMNALCDLLSGYGFDLAREKRTQQQIADVLAQASIPFDSECLLGLGDIVNFLIAEEAPFGGIALEVKTRARRRDIFRQLERYARHDRVAGILLLTGTTMGLPETINGKPARVLSAGRGWL